MVLRGLPFFLAAITIVLHQSVGMPTGTGLMIPLRTSSQRACFTGSLRWKGTGIGLCLALGVAPSFRCMWAGGPDIGGNAPLFLNAVLENCSRSQFLSLSTLFSVGGNGILWGRSGSWFLLVSGSVVSSIPAIFVWVGGITMGFGKFAGNIPTSIQAALLKYRR